MPSTTRKRRHQEVDDDSAQVSHKAQAPVASKEPSMLQRLRNMWQFANLYQFLLTFGAAVKVEPFDIEDLEAAILRPYTMDLQEIGLSLLKYLSSHRGLTHELFDEYSRRQFAAKTPDKPNPFGTEDNVARFADFDVFEKIRALHQMTLLILMNPEKLREKMLDIKDADHDQVGWRIEPWGWDSDERTYFVLDDNRIYRQTDAPPPPLPAAKPKKNSQKAKAAARASKRRRISAAAAVDSAAENADDEDAENLADQSVMKEDDGLGGAKWECVAVTVDDVRQFIAKFAKTKDGNEKTMRIRTEQHLLPILEGQEERRKKRDREREKELLNLEKMAHAKRSSRIAHKAEHERQEHAAKEAEQKRIADEAAAREAEKQRRKMERERDNRLMSRENRLKDREARRLQHEEELAQLSEDSKNLSNGKGRMSERHLQGEMERRKKALQDLEDDDEDEWTFDCVCGLHGQVDDGEHAVSCERCNVWQHSKCLNIKEKEAESEDFHFICDSCQRRQAAKEKEAARPVIKIKVKSPGSAAAASAKMSIDILAKPLAKSTPSTATPSSSAATATSSAATPKVNGAQQPTVTPNGVRQPHTVLQPPTQSASNPIPVKSDGVSPSIAPAAGIAGAPKLLPNGGSHNAFSSPHPALSPPDLSPNKSRAYSTIHDQSSPPAGSLSHQMMNNTSPSLNGAPRKLSITPILPPTLPRPVNNGPTSLPPVTTASPTKPQAAPATTKSTMPPITPTFPPVDAQPSTSSSMTTPKPAPRSDLEQGSAHKYEGSSPLLPPQLGGHSPTKHSPPAPAPHGSFGSSFGSAGGVLPMPSSSPTPSGMGMPPAPVLSPSLKPVDPTPPVKHEVAQQLPQPAGTLTGLGLVPPRENQL